MVSFFKRFFIFLLASVLILFLSFFSSNSSHSEGSRNNKSLENLLFFGKKFLGVKVCKTCHSSTVKDWRKTVHAKAFGLLESKGQETNDVCLQCHTTGFDKTVDNGGYDDKRKKELINVQCESCHGASAKFGPHGSKGSSKILAFTRTRLALNAKVCGQCHTKTVAQSHSKGQFDQWKNSQHKNALKDIKGHGETKNRCLRCHNVEKIYDENVDLTDAQFGIECAACHEPHKKKNPYQLRFFGKITLANGTEVEADVGAMCMQCHTDRIEDADSSADAGENPQYTQSEMLSGTGGVEYGETFENSYHATDNFKVSGKETNEKCITCHMFDTPADTEAGHNSVGSHSFAMRDKDNNINIKACYQCHSSSSFTTFDRKARGDYDGDKTTEGIQTEIEGLLDLLKTAIVASGNVTFSVDSFARPKFIFSAGATSEEKKAAFNWLFVNNDKSKGIHNTAYAVQLLQKSYKHLTGSDVPGATIR